MLVLTIVATRWCSGSGSASGFSMHSAFVPTPSLYSRRVDAHVPRGAREHPLARPGAVRVSDRNDGTSVSVDSHGTNLRQRGYTVLDEPLIPSDLIARARAKVKSRLQHLLTEVEAAGCNPFEKQYRFSEIVHRQRHRWDLHLQEASPHSAAAADASDSVWSELCSCALSFVTPVIREAQGGAYGGIVPNKIGAVISRPGARVQRFHCDATHEMFAAAKADASHRLYNVFVPLVDLEEDGDGTEFWGAPQLEESTRALARHFLSSPGDHPPLDVAHINSPRCQAGGVVIFDYRTIHRGLANPFETGRERCIAYITCSTGGAVDTYNFPSWGIHDVDPKVKDQFPSWNELQGRGRAQDFLDYYTEIEGADPFAISSN